MSNLKRIFSILICTLIICFMTAPISVLADDNDGRTWRVIASDSISYEGYAYIESKGTYETVVSTLEYEISGYVKNDPLIELTEKLDKEGDKYNEHTIWRHYHGYLSVGDEIHFKVTFKNVSNNYMYWVNPLTEDGNWGDGKCNQLDCAIQLMPSAQYEADYIVTDDVVSVDFGCRDDNALGETEINYVFEIGDYEDDNTQVVTQTAQTDPGEDNGTTIKEQIIKILDKENLEKAAISVAGATVAGAIALGGIDKNKDITGEEKKKQKTYKMKVYKNFGNGIHKGAKDVSVWARIVELVDGVENNCPDLSEKITVSGTGMFVESAGIVNGYMGAKCSVPKDSTAQTVTLTFTYSGAGGVFRNNVVFRVLDDPRIIFPKMTDDGKGWVVNSDISRINMIAGFGGIDRLRFVISNADAEPKDIHFKNTDGFDITYEKDTTLAYTYYACIKNKTAPIEKTNGIFASFADKQIIVEAVFDDGSIIDNYFTVRLYPDGLSVTADKQYMLDNHIKINTLPKKEVTPGYSPIDPTAFSLTLAYVNNNGVAEIVENPGFKYKPVHDDGENGRLFKENFEFEIKILSSNVFFYPNTTVPSLKDPYGAVLPVDVEKEGRIYHADIPLAVIGETPDPVSGKVIDREQELEKLRKDIAFFGLDSNPELLNMVRAAARGGFSGREIQNVRLRVIEAATAFYVEEGRAQKRMADLFSQYIVVAGALQTAGDYALRYAANYYWPGYGDITVCFLNPFKNMLFAFIGEQIANKGYLISAEYSDGVVPAQKIDFVEVALKSTEDAMASAIGFLINPSFAGHAWAVARRAKALDEIKNAMGYVVATYLLTCYVEHFYGYNGKGIRGEKGDVFRSAIAAFADLTYEGLKGFVFRFIEEKCKPLFDMIGKYIGSLYVKACQGRINAAAMKAGEKAFGENLLFKTIREDSSELSSEIYKYAKTMKEIARGQTFVTENMKLISTSAQIKYWLCTGENGNPQSIIAGQTLNYLLGGNGEDGTQAYGGDTKDVMCGALTKWLGVYIGNIYEGGKVLNPYDVTYRVENGKIIMGVFGYVAEINIFENIASICDLLFESLFPWMDALWEAGKIYFDAESIPDDRTRTFTSLGPIMDQLDKQKERNNRYDWQFIEFKKKTIP